MFHDKPCITMPVFSSGQSAKQAPGTYAGLGSADLIVTAGGGIMAHPDGPAAGVAGLREAWEATIADVPLDEYARGRPALAKALESYAS
jgi:ribulose-bisphosphate carboxylase large chain